MKTLNICFIGDTYTGKSHLIHTYVNGFKPPYVNHVTIGIEFNKKIFKNTILHIWDYSHLSIIDRYIESYLKEIDFFFIVVDCENIETIRNVFKYKHIVDNKPYYILVNKYDKIENILYKTKLLEYLRENFNNKYVFTSSYNKCELDNTINNIINMHLQNI